MAIFGDTFTVTVNTVPHNFTYIGALNEGYGSEYRELDVDPSEALTLVTKRDFGKRNRFLFQLTRNETLADGSKVQHTRNATLIFGAGGSVTITNDVGDTLLAILAKAECDNAAKGVY